MLSQKTGNSWTAERTTERVGCSALVIARSTIGSGRPEGAKGDSPGQSEAPPWDWCARNNPSPERAEPAARKPMCYVSPFQGLGELGRRRAQVAGVPRVALRSTLGYLIKPRWGERSGYGSVFEKTRGLSPVFFRSTISWPQGNCTKACWIIA